MSVIACQSVTKRYGNALALADFTFAFAAHSITAVVGRSGSGKSTLLQLINGLERPTTGRVLVFDQPIDYDQLPALRRQLGYAVQGIGLFPHMTVAENIQLPGRLLGWNEEHRNARCRELMQLVDLPSALVSRYPHELSGGQQQRVGICRALLLDPAIVLLDEPFGALDPITRSEIHAEMLRLQKKQPRTIVLVTHDMREAVKLGNRILVLDAGKIVQEGAREEVVARPATDFVAELIHSQLEL